MLSSSLTPPLFPRLNLKHKVTGLVGIPKTNPSPNIPLMIHQSTNAHGATDCGGQVVQGKDVVIFSGDIQLPERAGIPHPYSLPLLELHMCSFGSRAMPALPAHKADNLPPALHHFPGLLLLLTHSCYKSIAQCH